MNENQSFLDFLTTTSPASLYPELGLLKFIFDDCYFYGLEM